MYVVLMREKGVLLVEPVAGMSQGETVRSALGVEGGYSAGRVLVDVPEGADEAWAAWVEGEANGRPYFLLKAFHADLSEDEVTRLLAEAGETPLKLNRSPIYRVQPPPAE